MDAIESLAGARYFSTVDLAQGYCQILVAKKVQTKTAFRTGTGSWEFVRMPFALKGAPATFSKMMNLALKSLPPLQLALYMNDICIISDTFEKHLVNLRLLFDTLLQYGLQLYPKMSVCYVGSSHFLATR